MFVAFHPKSAWNGQAFGEGRVITISFTQVSESLRVDFVDGSGNMDIFPLDRSY